MSRFITLTQTSNRCQASCFSRSCRSQAACCRHCQDKPFLPLTHGCVCDPYHCLRRKAPQEFDLIRTEEGGFLYKPINGHVSGLDLRCPALQLNLGQTNFRIQTACLPCFKRSCPDRCPLNLKSLLQDSPLTETLAETLSYAVLNITFLPYHSMMIDPCRCCLTVWIEFSC